MDIDSFGWEETSQYPGKLIVLEGIDGAGKTTVLETLKQYFNQKDIHVIVTREPGGTPLGEILRDTLLHSKLEICPEAELLLMCAARYQHLIDVIYPALEIGSWVVCDRFTDSSFAYQGGGGQVNQHALQIMETFVQKSFRPDLVLLLDLPVKQALLRATQSDNFHSRLLDFYERVRQVYLYRAQSLKTHKIIDASRSAEAVEQTVLKELDLFVKRSYGRAH